MLRLKRVADTPAGLPEEQQAALTLWVTLARAYSSIAVHAQDDVREDGLSIGEFAVLELLFSRGQTLQGEMRKRVLVSSGGITFLVDKLAGKGLVERRDCPEDRRARYAALTKDGERLMRRIFPRHARRIAAAVAGITLAQQREMARRLKQLGMAAEAGVKAP